MPAFNKIVFGISFAAAITAAVPAFASSCSRYGGWGIGVTQDIATFMSTKAMHQALDKDSAKPAGGIKTECNTNALIYVQCHTFTKACGK